MHKERKGREGGLFCSRVSRASGKNGNAAGLHRSPHDIFLSGQMGFGKRRGDQWTRRRDMERSTRFTYIGEGRNPRTSESEV